MARHKHWSKSRRRSVERAGLFETGDAMATIPRSLAWFRSLKRKDFDNDKVREEIEAVFVARDGLLAAAKEIAESLSSERLVASDAVAWLSDEIAKAVRGLARLYSREIQDTLDPLRRAMMLSDGIQKAEGN